MKTHKKLLFIAVLMSVFFAVFPLAGTYIPYEIADNVQGFCIVLSLATIFTIAIEKEGGR